MADVALRWVVAWESPSSEGRPPEYLVAEPEGALFSANDLRTIAADAAEWPGWWDARVGRARRLSWADANQLVHHLRTEVRTAAGADYGAFRAVELTQARVALLVLAEVQ